MPAPIFYDGMPGAEIRRALNEWAAYVGDAAMPAESVTSLVVGNGTKILTVPAGRAYGVGQPVRISRTSDPSIWMGAVVTDYTGTQLTVEVETHDGSGTYSDWTIVLSGGAGPQGIPGEISDLTIGTVQAGAAPDVSITGTAPNQILNFTLEKGDKGDTGPANSLSIGNVQSGSSADASITGTAPSQTLNLTLPKGDAGDEVELQKTATHIQWRYTGGAWTNLVLLDDLKGEKGDEVEMQVTGTHIQWRVVGGSWADLISLSALTGVQGDAGWSPILASVADGTRFVFEITDWTGGAGSKPALGYIGPSGIVATKAAAVDIRGPAGTGDVNSVNSELPDGTGNVALEISHIPGLADAIAAAGQVKTVAGVLPDGVGDVPLEVVNISGLPTALSGKQDAASGMGLSANDYTTTEKDKLAGIAAGATNTAAPVQSDWNAGSGLAYINNKPAIPTIPAKMPVLEAEAGTATTQRTIDAATLKAAITENAPDPDVSGKADADLGNVTQANARTKVGTGTMAYRNVTISEDEPSGSGHNNGDFWVVV